MANLVAGVIIYAAGAAIGLFPRSAEAMGTTSLVLGVVATYSLVIAGEMGRDHHRRDFYAAVTIVVVGVMAVTYGSTEVGADRGFGLFFVVFGLASVAVGAFGVLQTRREMLAARSAQRRLKGLSWYSPR